MLTLIVILWILFHLHAPTWCITMVAVAIPLYIVVYGVSIVKRVKAVIESKRCKKVPIYRANTDEMTDK